MFSHIQFYFDSLHKLFLPFQGEWLGNSSVFLSVQDSKFQQKYNAKPIQDSFLLNSQLVLRVSLYNINGEWVTLTSQQHPLQQDVVKRSDSLRQEIDNEFEVFKLVFQENNGSSKKRSAPSSVFASDPNLFSFFFLGTRIFKCTVRECILVFKVITEHFERENDEPNYDLFVKRLFKKISENKQLKSNVDVQFNSDHSCKRLVALVYHLPWYFEHLSALRSGWKERIYRNCKTLESVCAGYFLKWCCNANRNFTMGIKQSYYYTPSSTLSTFLTRKKEGGTDYSVYPHFDNVLRLRSLPENRKTLFSWATSVVSKKKSNKSKEEGDDEAEDDEPEDGIKEPISVLARALREFLFFDLLFCSESIGTNNDVLSTLLEELNAIQQPKDKIPANALKLLDVQMSLKDGPFKMIPGIEWKKDLEKICIFKSCVDLDRENEKLFDVLVETLRQTAPPPDSELDDFLQELRTQNAALPEQLQQLEPMIREPISFLYGPPGTGKTSRGIKKVVEFYRSQPNCSIICLAPTGKAFREMCRQLQFESSVTDDDNNDNEDDSSEDDVDVDSEGKERNDDFDDKEGKIDIFQRGASLVDRDPSCFYRSIRPRLYEAFGIDSTVTDVIDYSPEAISSHPPIHPLKRKPAYDPYLSGTIHRFLLVFPRRVTKWRAAQKKKQLVIIVDEMSMVSANLFNSFLQTVLTNAFSKDSDTAPIKVIKVIFCGDPDQLPSIGYGNVFPGLLESPRYTPFHRHYSVIMRQSEQSADLVKLMHDLKTNIIDGKELLSIDIPQSTNQGVEQISVAVDNKSYKEDLYRLRPNLFLPVWREETSTWIPAAHVVCYLNEVKDEWNELLSEAFHSWKTQNGFFKDDQQDSLCFMKGNTKFRLFDKVRRTRNIRIHNKQENIEYLLANGDDAFIVAIDCDAKHVEVEYMLDGKREIMSWKLFNSSFVMAYSFTIHGSQGMTHYRTIMDLSNEDRNYLQKWYKKIGKTTFPGPLSYQSQLFYVATSRPSHSLVMIVSFDNQHEVRRERKLRCVSPISPFLRTVGSEYVVAHCGLPSCQRLVFCKSKDLPSTKSKEQLTKNRKCVFCKQNYITFRDQV
jgi:hypothetical protein